MKILWTLSIQLLLAVAIFANAPNEINSTQISLDRTGEKMSMDNFSHLPAYDKTDIATRMMTTKCLIQPRLDNDVEAYLRSYLTYGYRDAERTLGRTALYFPMIEHYLTIHNLPQELKYLPIIESSLRPYATSTAGAAGLWQFMVGTAKDNGLKINQNVDERRDPYKSTLAALKLLSSLYNEYGSWELALSAYNCGKGNVNRAIRNANSYDYEKVSRFLPRETRRYIPRFIAATYVAQNYMQHGLQPEWPDFDRQWTRTTKVYNYISFKKIAERTGVNYRVLKELNPSYQRNFIPTNTNGNYLILPEVSMIAFRNYQDEQKPAHRFGKYLHEDYYKSSYTVLSGDTMEKLAKMYNCSVYQIMEWNDLSSTDLYYRQELTLFHKKEKSWGLFGA